MHGLLDTYIYSLSPSVAFMEQQWEIFPSPLPINEDPTISRFIAAVVAEAKAGSYLYENE